MCVMTVAENIKIIRKEKGLTQKQLAELIGVSERSIQQFEYGQITPKYETDKSIELSFCQSRSDLYSFRYNKSFYKRFTERIGKKVFKIASEKNFENRIKSFLKSNNCYFIKYWGGGEFTKAGVPDILACCNGRFLGIEVKAKNGKPSPLQIHNLKKIDEAGGYGILLYPDHFELFKNFIDCLKVDDANTVYNYELLKRRWSDG